MDISIFSSSNPSLFLKDANSSSHQYLNLLPTSFSTARQTWTPTVFRSTYLPTQQPFLLMEEPIDGLGGSNPNKKLPILSSNMLSTSPLSFAVNLPSNQSAFQSTDFPTKQPFPLLDLTDSFDIISNIHPSISPSNHPDIVSSNNSFTPHIFENFIPKMMLPSETHQTMDQDEFELTEFPTRQPYPSIEPTYAFDIKTNINASDEFESTDLPTRQSIEPTDVSDIKSNINASDEPTDGFYIKSNINASDEFQSTSFPTRQPYPSIEPTNSFDKTYSTRQSIEPTDVSDIKSNINASDEPTDGFYIKSNINASDEFQSTSFPTRQPYPSIEPTNSFDNTSNTNTSDELQSTSFPTRQSYPSTEPINTFDNTSNINKSDNFQSTDFPRRHPFPSIQPTDAFDITSHINSNESSNKYLNVTAPECHDDKAYKSPLNRNFGCEIYDNGQNCHMWIPLLSDSEYIQLIKSCPVSCNISCGSFTANPSQYTSITSLPIQSAITSPTHSHIISPFPSIFPNKIISPFSFSPALSTDYPTNTSINESLTPTSTLTYQPSPNATYQMSNFLTLDLSNPPTSLFSSNQLENTTTEANVSSSKLPSAVPARRLTFRPTWKEKKSKDPLTRWSNFPSSILPEMSSSGPFSQPYEILSSAPSQKLSNVSFVIPSSFPSNTQLTTSKLFPVPSVIPSIQLPKKIDQTGTFKNGTKSYSCKTLMVKINENEDSKWCQICLEEVISIFCSVTCRLCEASLEPSINVIASTILSVIPSALPGPTSISTSTLPSVDTILLPSVGPSIIPSLLTNLPIKYNQSSLPSNLLISSLPTYLPSVSLPQVSSKGPSNQPSLIPNAIPSAVPSRWPSYVQSTMPTSLPLDFLGTLPSPDLSLTPSNLPDVDRYDHSNYITSATPTDFLINNLNLFPSTIPSSPLNSIPSSILNSIPSSIPNSILSVNMLLSTFPSMTPNSKSDSFESTSSSSPNYLSNTPIMATVDFSEIIFIPLIPLLHILEIHDKIIFEEIAFQYISDLVVQRQNPKISVRSVKILSQEVVKYQNSNSKVQDDSKDLLQFKSSKPLKSKKNVNNEDMGLQISVSVNGSILSNSLVPDNFVFNTISVGLRSSFNRFTDQLYSASPSFEVLEHSKNKATIQELKETNREKSSDNMPTMLWVGIGICGMLFITSGLFLVPYIKRKKNIAQLTDKSIDLLSLSSEYLTPRGASIDLSPRSLESGVWTERSVGSLMTSFNESIQQLEKNDSLLPAQSDSTDDTSSLGINIPPEALRLAQQSLHTGEILNEISPKKSTINNSFGQENPFSQHKNAKIAFGQTKVCETGPTRQNIKEERELPYEIYDFFAPSGKLGFLIDTTPDGPMVITIKRSSQLFGFIQDGDLIIGLDDIDTRYMTASSLTRLMDIKSRETYRRISVLRQSTTLIT